MIPLHVMIIIALATKVPEIPIPPIGPNGIVDPRVMSADGVPMGAAAAKRPAPPSYMVLEAEEETPFKGKRRVLSIPISSQDADNLSLTMKHVKTARPMTYDLFTDALTCLDARIDHVVINDVVGSTFFARLYLRQGGRLIEIDSRPSDAIALAVREDAPIYAEESVLSRAAFPFIIKGNVDKKSELEEFDSFIENLKPEDII